MLHTTNKQVLCSILRAVSLQDYLTETGSETDLTPQMKTLLRIEAREVGGSNAAFEGADNELCSLISEYIGTSVSCLIQCGTPEKVGEVKAKINGKVGAKVPFTIYEASVRDILLSIGKSGETIKSSDGAKRYTRLSRSYFGAIGETRAADAANSFIADVEKLLSDGWTIESDTKAGE